MSSFGHYGHENRIPAAPYSGCHGGPQRKDEEFLVHRSFWVPARTEKGAASKLDAGLNDLPNGIRVHHDK
jgi:hypothetical protein